MVWMSEHQTQSIPHSDPRKLLLDSSREDKRIPVAALGGSEASLIPYQQAGQPLLCWRDGGGGLQDPPQHLVVVERLVLLGGVTGAVVCGEGVREAQHPEAIRRQQDVCLFRVEERAGRRTRLDLKTHIGLFGYFNI